MSIVSDEEVLAMGNPLDEYALKVLDGELIAGPYVRAACERHLTDMKRDDIYLDLRVVHGVAMFFKLLKHWQGDAAGERCDLMLWQLFIDGSAWGWKRKATGKRRFRKIYQEVAAKNGKTFRASGNGLWALVMDGEKGAEIYSVATNKDQAKICFENARNIINESTQLSEICKAYTQNINVPASLGKFQFLTGKKQGKAGLNPSFYVYDEYWEWTDRGFAEVLRNRVAARSNYFEYIITTAGNDVNTICYELREHAINVLDSQQPDYRDDNLFAYIACPDKDDDHSKIETWMKANPGLGVIKHIDVMQSMYDSAVALPSEMPGFLREHLDIWVNEVTRWLNLEKWNACCGAVDKELLEGKRCYGGFDLAEVHDLSAFILLFPPSSTGSSWVCLSWFFCPEENIKKRSEVDRVNYDLWRDQGYLIATPGETVKRKKIIDKIFELRDIYNIVEVGFDAWGLSDAKDDLIAGDVPCKSVRNGFATMTAPVGELERLIMAEELLCEQNPVMTYCMGNATLKRGDNKAKKIVKPRDEKKRVDGAVALAYAMERAIAGEAQDKPREEYKGDGVTFLPLGVG